MTPPLQHDPVAQAHQNWAGHGWEESADAMAAVTSLFRAQQILMARIDAVLRPLDLTFARFEMLTLLGFSRTGAMPLAKASSRLQVHPTSVTNTVERLGQAGLVERQPHPTDGRANLIAITPQGRDLALQAARELNRKVFTDLGLPAGELTDLNRILGTLRFSAGDFSEPSELMGGSVPDAGSGPVRDSGPGPRTGDREAATDVAIVRGEEQTAAPGRMPDQSGDKPARPRKRRLPRA
ncbi:MarR family winged helix-turn-helix transcriptional regulator [Citricoccus sp. K5]|uniref:MarR family winged helix-turn-helix transcriptional regulator n=1 Tax=Citricoccus sp. K5 TaxID=2653135 RepID=UPI0012EFFC2C|nr:DNA-binding MarR family transcriptional regulator [Citricoccus sp. K5]